MNLFDIINNYRDELLNKGILVEYNLYFNEVCKKQCKFAIDETKELEKLNNKIFNLKEKDKNAEIYVSTYNIFFVEEKMHIYADSIWIDTILEVEDLYDCFKDCQEIEPSDIALLTGDETIDGLVAFVISKEGIVVDYKSFIEKRQLDKIKSLYWD